MKKLLFSLIIIMSTLNLFAQTVEMDKVDEHGDRFIFCSLESIRSFTDKIVFFVSLNAAQNKGGSVFYDIILRTNANSPLSVPKGGRLLIKLTDDSVIELKTQKEYSDKVGEVKSGSGLVYSAYSISPSFTITPKQISLISNGVKKIRLETTLDPIDKEFKKDKMGKVIKEEYALINQTLSQNKSFSNGF